MQWPSPRQWEKLVGQGSHTPPQIKLVKAKWQSKCRTRFPCLVVQSKKIYKKRFCFWKNGCSSSKSLQKGRPNAQVHRVHWTCFFLGVYWYWSDVRTTLQWNESRNQSASSRQTSTPVDVTPDTRNWAVSLWGFGNGFTRFKWSTESTLITKPHE
jgi:hypothetical protein